MPRQKLKPEALAVTVRGQSIIDLCDMPVSQCAMWMEHLRLEGAAARIAAEVLKEIRARLAFLNDVGLIT